MQTIHNTHPITVRKHDGIHDTSLISQLLKTTAATFRRFASRRKIKHMLDLSPHLLDDIGLTRPTSLMPSAQAGFRTRPTS